MPRSVPAEARLLGVSRFTLYAHVPELASRHPAALSPPDRPAA